MPDVWRVHWCRCAGSLCYFADVSNIGQNTAGCSAFCPLVCFVLGALLANVALFRVFRAFLAGFGVIVWVCVVWVAAGGLHGIRLAGAGYHPSDADAGHELYRTRHTNDSFGYVGCDESGLC